MCSCLADVSIVVDEAFRNVTVTEGGAVRICARILGRADFIIPASFQPSVLPASASVGQDFSNDALHFQFPANSAALQCIEVQTVDDNVVEGSEAFQVHLAMAESRNAKVALGLHVTAHVTIIDNDCEST